METTSSHEIPNWQKERVRERTESYLKNPSSAQDIDEAIEDILSQL